jgi:hypothetical protein
MPPAVWTRPFAMGGAWWLLRVGKWGSGFGCWRLGVGAVKGWEVGRRVWLLEAGKWGWAWGGGFGCWRLGVGQPGWRDGRRNVPPRAYPRIILLRL